MKILSLDEIKTLKRFGELLWNWSRKKIETAHPSPENTYYGNLIIKVLRDENEQLYEKVVHILRGFDFKIAYKIEIEIEELLQRADKVDLENKTPDYVQNYAAYISKELELLINTNS
jgi:hypothetical protein